MLRFRTLFLALGGAVLMTATASASVFSPQVFTLDNGLEVALVENHRIPAVTHMVWYRVGAVDEPAGKSGIAHFLEHLMFKGTEKIAPGEFSKIIARHGGEDNAFTSWDYTAYFQKISADNLPKVMEMEADRMRNLLLGDKTVLSERDVIIEERRQRVDTQPMALLDEQLMNVLYQNQPYRIPVIGWLHEMQGLSKDDALNFYRKYYAPSNAILVVSGAVTKQELKALAEKTYGRLPKLPRPERLMPAEPPSIAPRSIAYTSAKAELPMAKMAWLTPSVRTAENTKTVYALKVLEQYLAGSGASFLYEELVLKQKVATDLGFYAETDRLGQGSVSLAIIPVNAKPASFAKAESAALKVLERVANGEVDAASLRRAKSALQANAIYARDSLMTPAMVVGEALVLGQSIADIEAWPTRIGAVTAEDIKEAAALLDTNSVVTARLYPAGKAGSAAAALPPASAGVLH